MAFKLRACFRLQALPVVCGRDADIAAVGWLGILVGHLEKDQIGELFQVVAIAHSVIAQGGAEAPDFRDDRLRSHTSFLIIPSLEGCRVSGGVGCPLRPFLAHTLLVLKPVPGLPDARRLLEHLLKRRNRAALFPYLKFADRLANQRGRGHTRNAARAVPPLVDTMPTASGPVYRAIRVLY